MVSGSVSSWLNEQHNKFRWGSVGVGVVGNWDSKDACGEKAEARGAGLKLVSDAGTYTDMIGAESRTACKHI